MELTIIFMSLLSCVAVAMNSSANEGRLANSDEPIANLSDPNKDMYVIHAMVYQIGIITNKTDDEVNNTMGNQEAITFYHNNGSGIDFTKIPAPLLTNVTAERLVGVAPTNVQTKSSDNTLPWVDLEKLAAAQHPSMNAQDPVKMKRQLREIASDVNFVQENYADAVGDSDYLDESHPYWGTLTKRSTESNQYLTKEVSGDNKKPVKIISGAAVIPEEASVQSISIPPLLILNNNFSQIPVPIPNTSVVHYAKVNTLIHAH